MKPSVLLTKINTEKFTLTLQMAGFSIQTVSTLRTQVRIFLREIGVLPGQVTSRMLRNYLSELSTHLSPRTLAVKIQAIRKYYDYLHETGQILINPATGLRLPELRRWQPMLVLSAREMDRIRLKAAGTSLLSFRNRALLEVLYGTGLRASELSALNITDIDFTDGLIHIYGGKGGRDRCAVLTEASASAIRDYLRFRQTSPDDNPALWITCQGRRMNRHVIFKMIRRLARLAGVVTPSNPHAWRHGVATALLRRGASIVAIQRFLGHASLRTTQVYTHIAIGDLKENHRRYHPRERDPIPEDIAPLFSKRFRS